jgi:hypothetical protein
MSDFDPSQYKDPPKGLQFDFSPDELRTFLEKRAAEHDACAKAWQECADSEKQLRYYQAADFVAKTKRARENGEKLPPRLPLETVRQGCLENVKNNELAAKNLRDLLIPHIAERQATFDLKGALDIAADITPRSGPPPVDQDVRDAVDQEMAEEAAKASPKDMKGEPVATNLARPWRPDDSPLAEAEPAPAASYQQQEPSKKAAKHRSWSCGSRAALTAARRLEAESAA